MTNNLLVTGATGFIGRHLIHLLLKEHHRVYVLLRSIQQASNLPREVSVRIGDLTRPSTLIDACKDIDTIYHLAGYAHAAHQKTSGFSEKHHEINFLGTKNLIAAAEYTHVTQFIFISSSKAVADSPHRINESWQALPDSPYGIAKRHAEELVKSFGQTSGRHICILRPALVYGPGCKGNLYSMIKAIDKGYFLPIPDIQNRRSMVSLYDICQAAIFATKHENANGKIYFVTDGKPYSTYEIYTGIRTALGQSLPSWHVPHIVIKMLGYMGDITEKILNKDLPINSDKVVRLFDSAEYDSSRIQDDLHFKPKYNFFSMLPEMIAAYRGNFTQEAI